ncbi:hypothetical protein Ocin01_08361 [Orchesella cincta]|uniref:Uncharacterized protein n=1 Tax=Orchesella cincta TaxID=48709 RepID=A0A1D2MZ50_ORCCI|nr:hypothetical protein Ocin01_08361 [Orchesella cincta]
MDRELLYSSPPPSSNSNLFSFGSASSLIHESVFVVLQTKIETLNKCSQAVELEWEEICQFPLKFLLNEMSPSRLLQPSDGF